ncbi:hypothetical protein EVAR_71465_1 [Eumeta japonica]|uniref:Uncharacterized protein n=1 Tax=Eumeta variegata TaxID=151549 RepID=A0A4C1SKK7_EUMVA|nr:hypothetical protein EVAR_71465_1 [Eumeta japonica]
MNSQKTAAMFIVGLDGRSLHYDLLLPCKSISSNLFYQELMRLKQEAARGEVEAGRCVISFPQTPPRDSERRKTRALRRATRTPEVTAARPFRGRTNGARQPHVRADLVDFNCIMRNETNVCAGPKPRSGLDRNEIKDEERNRHYDGHGVIISKRGVENKSKDRTKI